MQIAGYGDKCGLSPDLSTENVENYSALSIETPSLHSKVNIELRGEDLDETELGNGTLC